MNWKKAGNIVNKIIPDSGGNLKDRMEEAWNDIGEKDKADPVHFSKGILTLKVKNSTYLQVLTYKKEEIKGKLNSRLDIEIKNIKFIFS